MRVGPGHVASLAIALSALTAIGLAACSPIVDVRGHTPTPGTMEKLEVGSQSRDDVLRLLGSPSTVSNFGDGIWYYIHQRQESMAFLEPRIAEQRVTAISFGDNGRIQEIKTYDLKDAKNPGMVSRTTPTVGKELTLLEQVMGNVGRFSTPKR